MRNFSLGLFSSSSALYLLSALVGVWAASSGTTAWQRFALFAFGIFGMVAMVIVSHRVSMSDQLLSIWLGRAGLVLAYASIVVAVAYVFTPYLASNVAAGVLVVLIPLGAAGLLWASRQHLRLVVLSATLALSVALLALLLTLERSAWLALCVGSAIAIFCQSYFGPIYHPGIRRLATASVLLALILLSASVLLLFTVPISWTFVSNLLDSSPYGRLYIWRDVLTLIQDYRFTGSGLGETGMMLSTYLYLYQVPFLFQVYNLFLQIALEQGVPGLVGFVGMVVAALLCIVMAYQEKQPSMRWFCTATLAAIIAFIVHGTLDAGLYISNLVPIIFLPLGIGMVLPAMPMLGKSSATTEVPRRAVMISVSLLLVAFIFALVRPGLRSAWYANLGAVEQSRLELSKYEWPLWPIQDELRRSNSIDLSTAEAYFQFSLQLDSENATAHRRLGQIALSQGDYDLARNHLQLAHKIAPDDRVTRQLLGELYAVTGEIKDAVAVWQSGDTDVHKLELRQWWYSHLGADQQSRWLNEAVALYKHAIGHSS